MSVKPLVLLSSARSGSNYFLSVVKEMAPHAVVLREVFRAGGDNLPELAQLTGLPKDRLADLGQTAPLELWDRVRQGAGDRPLALKIFYYHAKPESPIWDRIADEARIVHLYRRRVLDTYISLSLAKTTGHWHALKDAPKPETLPKLTLEPGDVAAFISDRQRYVADFRDRFRNADIHELSYEEIAANPQDCAARIACIQGWPLPRTPITPPIRKQNTAAARDIVSNYHEIAEFDRIHL